MAITSHDIDLLISHGEGSKTEFKATLDLGSKEARAEFVLDMLSLVNSHGDRPSVLIIGYDERGCRRVDISGFHLDDSRLQQLVNSYVEPPIAFSFRQVESQGVVLGIIEIPPSAERFHVVSKDMRVDDKTLLIEGDIRIRQGTSKRRPTAWDHKLLRDEYAKSQVVQPLIDVSFANGSREVELASDWTEKERKQYGLMGVPMPELAYFDSEEQFPAGTAPLRFLVQNVGTSQAENIHVFIDVPEDCSIAERRNYLSAVRPASAPWRTTECPEDGQIRISGKDLIHRLIHRSDLTYVTFPRPDESYELRWSAHVGNMQVPSRGVLTVRILPASVPPTVDFPEDGS